MLVGMSLKKKSIEVREIRGDEIGKLCRGELHRDGVWLTYDSFYKNSCRGDGYDSVCKACYRASHDRGYDRVKRWQVESGYRLESNPGAKERMRRFEEADPSRIEDFCDS